MTTGGEDFFARECSQLRNPGIGARELPDAEGVGMIGAYGTLEVMYSRAKFSVGWQILWSRTRLFTSRLEELHPPEGMAARARLGRTQRASPERS